MWCKIISASSFIANWILNGKACELRHWTGGGMKNKLKVKEREEDGTSIWKGMFKSTNRCCNEQSKTPTVDGKRFRQARARKRSRNAYASCLWQVTKIISIDPTCPESRSTYCDDNSIFIMFSVRFWTEKLVFCCCCCCCCYLSLFVLRVLLLRFVCIILLLLSFILITLTIIVQIHILVSYMNASWILSILTIAV